MFGLNQITFLRYHYQILDSSFDILNLLEAQGLLLTLCLGQTACS